MSQDSKIQLIQFSASSVKPLFVAAKDVDKIVVGWSPKTAANMRCQKVGPRFFMVGGRPYYKVSDLVEYFGRNPVETLDGDSDER